MKHHIRIGTRGSQLALWQARFVSAQIQKSHPAIEVELLIIKTKGDKILDVPLAKVGGKGLFIKEIEDALLEGRVDLAVHSMKDLPALLPDGLIIGAVPEREDPRDVLISRNSRGLSDLPRAPIVGTSSLRRTAQLKALRPDAGFVALRGNLGTRLRKLAQGEMDVIVLAAAGLKRLELSDRITQYLEPGQMLPAVGQGALGIEIRAVDPFLTEVTASLDDAATRLAVSAERAFLHCLEGSCQVPVAALGRIDGDQLTIQGLVAELDGSRVLKETLTGKSTQAVALGIDLAQRLKARGADEILARLSAVAP